MGFFKKALLLGGVPVRPSTKRERFQYKSADELAAQTDLLAEQNKLLAAREPAASSSGGRDPEAVLTRHDAIRRLAHLAGLEVLSEDEFATAKEAVLSMPGNDLDGSALIALEEAADLWGVGVLTSDEMTREKDRLFRELKAELSGVQVVITSAGTRPIPVAMLLRNAMNLKLREAHALVDYPGPVSVAKGLDQDEAEALKRQFEAEGATVELR